MKKILFIAPSEETPWYVQNHIEYLIRYLGNEYIMDQGYVGDDNPLLKNPDDYDLLVPLRSTHPKVDLEKYGRKTAMILWEPDERNWDKSVICAATTPMAAKSMKRWKHPYVEATPGIDTELFKHYDLLREDDGLLHVGVIGCAHNPRHRVKSVILPLLDIPGVKFDFYIRNWVNNDSDVEQSGGEEIMKRVVDGNKVWTGVPNVYNRMDVLLKVDGDPGLTFPILEAAACEIPFVSTFVGIEHLFMDAGLVIIPDKTDPNGNGRKWYYENTDEVVKRCRAAIEWMRDRPLERKGMGMNGRRKVLKRFTWEKQLPKWREFFDRALKLCH